MTTLDDIREAQHTAYQNHMAAYPDFHGDREDTDTYRRLFAQAMGIEVEDPKPGPGLYRHDDGYPVMLYGPGFHDGVGRGYLIADPDSIWAKENRDKLTPARVVPAEPVELTEEQVGELHDRIRPQFTKSFGDSSPSVRKSTMHFAQALLAKYGHGAA